VALQPVHRRSVPDEVFDQLVADIVDGELSPGEQLPSERRLAEVLGVSRPAIREALQRLSHAGLIDVKQGDTTTVRDFRRHAGLDLLPRLLAGAHGPDLEVVRSVLEVRMTLAPDVARRCAQRRTDEDAGRLRELLDDLQAADGDLTVLQTAAHGFWHAVVDGSRNVVYRLLFNALEAAYVPVMPVLTEVLADELTELDGYRAIVDAVDRRDGAQAAAAARRIVGRGTATGLALLDQLSAEARPDATAS
jgi:GntR family transcriptional regulator, transcriptional repressor for pyruvate dehydrogenase complex